MKAAPLALAGLALALFLPQQVRLAQQKPFWLDEGHEWGVNCAQPAPELIRQGASEQCSPSPGYYLLEQAWGRFIAIGDEGILVTYRALSLAAAGALLLMLSSSLAARLGLPCALAALASLLGQPLFHHYASESRPYALALWLFALVLLLLAEGAAKEARPGWGWTALAAAACVGSSLVLLTGAVQAVAACAAFLLLLRVQGEPLRSRRSAGVVILLAVCAATALYYRARSPCLAGDAGPLSVSGVQGRNLLGDVIRLFWTDSAWVNLLALTGFAAPAWAWRRRAAGERADSFVLALGVLVVAELLLTVALAVQIARADYYFLPRLFLHLMVCRALLVGMGLWLLLRLLPRTRPWGLVPVAAALVSAAGVWIALSMLRREVEEWRAAAPWHGRASAPCRSWPVPLRILLAGQPPWDFGPNVLVEAAHEAKRCGSTRAEGPRYLVASPDGARTMAAVPPPGAVPLRQCGREAVLDTGRAR
jgi:hypothetical protein